MKRTFYLALASALFFSYCGKQVENIPHTQPPSKTKYLFANAGSDTTICMPYGGTGIFFKGILDGRASLDDSGKIVNYSWTDIGGESPSILYPYKDSTEVKMSGGIHQFLLEVRDDHGQVDFDDVTINVIQQFDYEYDGISWDSTIGILTTISVKVVPGLIESWPDFAQSDRNRSAVYLSDFKGECNDISSWKNLPYVPYENIQLTDNLVFYSLISDPPNGVIHGTLYPEIFAKSNSGIDFKQKVSIGFINPNPWDY
jgi:hypothetical protein